MLTAFWTAAAGFLVSLLVWSAIFVAAALATGELVRRWCRRRLRQSAAPRWLFQVWIVVMVFATPAGIALFQAVPFALARGLAHMVERSAPEAAMWMTSLAADQVADLMSITHGDTVVDVADLKIRAEAAAADLLASRDGLSTLGWIQNVAMEKSLRAILLALDQLGPEGGRVTWRDVTERSRTLSATGSSMMTADVVTGLHLTAWLQVWQAVALVALCHGLTVVLFHLAVRPAGSSPGGPGQGTRDPDPTAFGQRIPTSPLTDASSFGES